MLMWLEDLGSQELAETDAVVTFWGYKNCLGPQKLEDTWVGQGTGFSGAHQETRAMEKTQTCRNWPGPGEDQQLGP